MKIEQKAAEIARAAAEQLEDAARNWALAQLEKKIDSNEWKSCFKDTSYVPDAAKQMADGIAECLIETPCSRWLYRAQRQYDYLNQWLDQIESLLSQEGIPIHIDEDERPVCPMIEDRNIQLLRLLHQDVSKETIRQKLGLRSGRAVQDKMAALTQPQKSKGEPLRIAGRVVYAKVAQHYTTDENGRRIKQYRTPNTLHPITLQLNVFELLTLYQALHMQNRPTGDRIAKDIWVQLSDYARERLKNLANDSTIRFLMKLDDSDELLHYLEKMQQPDTEDDNYFDNMNLPIFRTERELLHSEQICTEDRISLLYKGGRVFDIKWLENGKIRTLNRQIVQSMEGDTICVKPEKGSAAEETEITLGAICDLFLCE